MPSDQDENRAVWQNADELEWELPAAASGSPVASMLSDEDDQSLAEDIDTDDLLEPDTESDLLHWSRPPLLSKETLRTVARQLSPVLVPLPFALLVFLFTLPATLQGPPAHPSVLVTGMLSLFGALLTRNAALGLIIAAVPLAGSLFLYAKLVSIPETHPFFLSYTFSGGQDAHDWWVNRLTLLGIAGAFTIGNWWLLRREERLLGNGL